MENEIWKQIKGYEGFYEVSNNGRIKSLERTIVRSDGHRKTVKERILSQKASKDGYCRVSLYNENGKRFASVHRLVAEAFVENPENKPCIDHIDGCKTNNISSNLRYCSQLENVNNPNTLVNLRIACKDKERINRILKTKKKVNNKLIVGVKQYEKDGTYIKRYFSMTDAAKSVDGTISGIAYALNNNARSYKGYLWTDENCLSCKPYNGNSSKQG